MKIQTSETTMNSEHYASMFYAISSGSEVFVAKENQIPANCKLKYYGFKKVKSVSKLPEDIDLQVTFCVTTSNIYYRPM